MKVIADISIIPIGVGVTLSRYIATCESIFIEAGLNPQLQPNGTNVEGEWEIVFNALKRCHERLHEMDVPRISTNIRLGTRVDKEQKMADKIESVIEHMKRLSDEA